MDDLEPNLKLKENPFELVETYLYKYIVGKTSHPIGGNQPVKTLYLTVSILNRTKAMRSRYQLNLWYT